MHDRSSNPIHKTALGKSMGKIPPFWKSVLLIDFLSLLGSTESEHCFAQKIFMTSTWNAKESGCVLGIPKKEKDCYIFYNVWSSYFVRK